jgi:hypothetical protein
MASVINATYCAHEGDQCPSDPMATCKLFTPPTADLSVIDECTPGAALSTIAGCTRDCTTDSECTTISNEQHIPYTCANNACIPSLPTFTPCGSDAVCPATLHCTPPSPSGVGAPYPTCTASCATDVDCAQNPALGSAFVCVAMRCIGKTQSGCKPPAPVNGLCLTGTLVGGYCVSPPGWPCDKDTQCASGQCDKSRGALGHCQ